MESDYSARSTWESAKTTQERPPWLAKPSDQASTGRRPWPTLRLSSDDAQDASSSQSNNTSRLRPCGRSLHPGHSPVGDSTRWDHSRRHKGYYTHIFIAIDKFTNWIEVKPVSSTSAAKAVEFIEEIMHRFGVPNRITTDLGSSFTGSEFWDFC